MKLFLLTLALAAVAFLSTSCSCGCNQKANTANPSSTDNPPVMINK